MLLLDPRRDLGGCARGCRRRGGLHDVVDQQHQSGDPQRRERRYQERRGQDHAPGRPSDQVCEDLVGNGRQQRSPGTPRADRVGHEVVEHFAQVAHRVFEEVDDVLPTGHVLQILLEQVGQEVRTVHRRTGFSGLGLRRHLLHVGRCGTCLPHTGFEQHRRRCSGWGSHDGSSRDGLIGGHGGGCLDPHPDVVGLVDRDRNHVDTEEVRGDQDTVYDVVQRELGQRRHGGHCRGVGRGGGLVLYRDRGTVGALLRQPGQVRPVRGDVLLRTRPFPSAGLHPTQHTGEFCCRRGVFGAQRLPRPRCGQQRPGAWTAGEQRRVHLGW